MLITADDISGMASPGWECGGSDFEVLEEGFEEVLEEDCSEIDLVEPEKGAPGPEEEPEKPVRYTDGCREGLTTLTICTRLKNEKMTETNRMEQEFSAILRTYPKNSQTSHRNTWRYIALWASFLSQGLRTKFTEEMETLRKQSVDLRHALVQSISERETQPAMGQ